MHFCRTFLRNLGTENVFVSPSKLSPVSFLIILEGYTVILCSQVLLLERFHQEVISWSHVSLGDEGTSLFKRTTSIYNTRT